MLASLAIARPAFVAAFTLVTMSAGAQTLYATTASRSGGPSGTTGALYVIDSKTASAKLVGPVRAPGLAPASLGITGLATHPQTKVLYGITAGLEMPPSLVTIDPKTGQATVIGPLGASASDINFDATGTLFAWLSASNQLARVNLTTGAATPVGTSGLMGSGGGLAIDRNGAAFAAPNTAVGTLDSINLQSGAGTPGALLTGAPYLSAINSLTFSPEGELFGVDSNLGAPAKTALVVINTKTGVVSLIGQLPDDTDGLAFSPDAVAPVPQATIAPSMWIFIAMAATILFAALILRLRRAGA